MTISATPPSNEDILAAVIEALPRHADNPLTAAQNALGLDHGEWNELDPNMGNARSNWDANAWRLFSHIIGINPVPHGNQGHSVALIRSEMARGTARWQRLAAITTEIRQQSEIPAIACWQGTACANAILDAVPQPYINVMFPVEGAHTERMNFEGVRIMALAEDARPFAAQNAEEVRSAEGELYGWTEGRNFWMRFHPFLNLSQLRLTFATAPARVEAFKAAILAAQSQLIFQPNASPQFDRQRWEAAVAYARTMAYTLHNSASALRQSILSERNSISRRIESHTRSIARERQQITNWQRAIAESEARIVEYEAIQTQDRAIEEALPDPADAYAARIRVTIESLQERMENALSLASVASVELVASGSVYTPVTMVKITSHPLHVSLNGTMRCLGPQTLTLNVYDSSLQTNFIVESAGHAHPSMSRDSNERPWQASNVALAQALGEGNMRTVAQLVFSSLARPVDAEISNIANIPASPEGTRAGYVPEEVVIEDVETEETAQAGDAENTAPVAADSADNVANNTASENETTPSVAAEADTSEIAALVAVETNDAPAETTEAVSENEHSDVESAVPTPARIRRSDTAAQQYAIRSVLSSVDGSLTAAEISERLADEYSLTVDRERVRAILYRMTQRGELQRASRGRWQIGQEAMQNLTSHLQRVNQGR